MFSVTLNYISEKVLPELTDAWVAENYGESDGVHTVEELKALYQKMLYNTNLQNAIMDDLLANSTFKELPKEVTDYQVNQCLNYYYTMANYYGYDLDSFVQTAAGYENADALLEGMSDSITTYSKEALLYQAVAETLDIVPTQEQIDTYPPTPAPMVRTTAPWSPDGCRNRCADGKRSGELSLLHLHIKKSVCRFGSAGAAFLSCLQTICELLPYHRKPY